MIDGQSLCETVNGGAPPLPGPGVPSRVVDLATGRTVVDLGDTFLLWPQQNVFGPPVDTGLPGIVAVSDVMTDTVTVHDLTTGEELGSYAPAGEFLLSFVLSSDGHRLMVGTGAGKSPCSMWTRWPTPTIRRTPSNGR